MTTTKLTTTTTSLMSFTCFLLVVVVIAYSFCFPVIDKFIYFFYFFPQKILNDSCIKLKFRPIYFLNCIFFFGFYFNNN